MSNEPKKQEQPAAKPEEKPRAKRVVVKLLRPVQGIVNNVWEICGFTPEMAAKLLDKNRQGGTCAELYEPPKR